MSDSVRFNLWAVMTFLFMVGAAAIGVIYAEGRETKATQVNVLQRLSTVEAQYKSIVCGIDELKAGQKEVYNLLAAHERNSNGKKK